MNIYDFTVKDGKGKDVSLASFKGKVLLIVNTATECGFTPQYKGLEELYEKYHIKGLEILDFPCNQFGKQAPGTDEEIQKFCELNYSTRFAQMQKIDVNGANASPLFVFLKKQKSFAGFTGEKKEFMENFIVKNDPDYKNNAEIKWNFTKFLIDKTGNVIERFESTTDPKEIEEKVALLL